LHGIRFATIRPESVSDNEGVTVRKDLLLTFGSMAGVGAVVFGLGFVALSFLVKPGNTDAHASAEAHGDEHGEGHGDKKDAHGAEKSGGHGEKADAHGKAEAKGHDTHGDDKKDDHGAHDEKGHDAKGHGEEAPKGDSHSQTPPAASNAERLKLLDEKYKGFVTRGLHDEARTITAKAFTITPKNDPDWLQRAADSTFQSQDLGAQQRCAKALEIYTDLLNSTSANLNDEHREWAQWRICQCLQNLMRFDDAIRAMKIYLEQYPKNARRHETRLGYAQCLVAQGRTPEASDVLEQITGADVPKEVAARALNERARITLERSKNEVPDAPIKVASPNEPPIVNKDHVLPANPTDEAGLLKGVIQKIEDPEHVEHRPARGEARQPAHEHASADTQPKHSAGHQVDHVATKPDNDLSTEQWATIRKAAQDGEYTKLDELMKPYTDPSSTISEQQRAKVMIRYAAILTEIAQSGRK
jgi:tetratricopeptide (TPR) repeat protein